MLNPERARAATATRPPSRPVPSLPHALEEIFLAVNAVPAAEALLGQLRLAVGAFQALAVPVPVQDFEDEPVHDVLVAAGAQRDLCGEAAPVSPGGPSASRPTTATARKKELFVQIRCCGVAESSELPHRAVTGRSARENRDKQEGK